MGWGQAWRALWGRETEERKASATHPLLVHLGIGQPRWTPRRYDKLAEEGYQNNVIAYRCVRLIAQNAASVPWLARERRGERTRELEQHPLLDHYIRTVKQSKFFRGADGLGSPVEKGMKLRIVRHRFSPSFAPPKKSAA